MFTYIQNKITTQQQPYRRTGHENTTQYILQTSIKRSSNKSAENIYFDRYRPETIGNRMWIIMSPTAAKKTLLNMNVKEEEVEEGI